MIEFQQEDSNGVTIHLNRLEVSRVNSISFLIKDIMKSYVISESCCGDASTSIVSSRSKADVCRMLLMTRYHAISPDNEALGLKETDANMCLAALVTEMTPGDHYNHVETPTELGRYEKFRDLSKPELLANLSDADIEVLFKYAFSGGYGEQRGDPGKEWTTIEVARLDKLKPENVYEKFDPTLHVRAESTNFRVLVDATGKVITKTI